jgi:DNA-directed RNA polymerase III subunit RPC6
MVRSKMATASPAPAASTSGGSSNRVADALYSWATLNYEAGHIFAQDELQNSGIIPNSDVQVLLDCVSYLVHKSLFRVHDRHGGNIGWELIDAEVAKK